MIRIVRDVCLIVFFTFVFMAALAWAEPAQRLPLIKADLPYCFTIKNPPLELTKPDTEAHPRRPDTA